MRFNRRWRLNSIANLVVKVQLNHEWNSFDIHFGQYWPWLSNFTLLFLLNPLAFMAISWRNLLNQLTSLLFLFISVCFGQNETLLLQPCFKVNQKWPTGVSFTRNGGHTSYVLSHHSKPKYDFICGQVIQSISHVLH